ncbi:MAG: hypothetical protein IPK82_40315 [Polyangiaceae bacterium]|nr:hypothetical protein [Polyangiaceae bacterium]
MKYTCLLCLILSAACAPAPPGTVVNVANEQSSAPSNLPIPPALPVEVAPFRAPSVYTQFQAKEVSGQATPWVDELASQLGVNLAALVKNVVVSTANSGSAPVMLVSPAHQTGDFTFVRSSTVRLYQLLPITIGASLGRFDLVLAADRPPPDQLQDGSTIVWTLVLASDSGASAAVLKLETPLPKAPGLWDVISTSLSVSQRRIRVEIGVSHSGGGDSCDRTYPFVIRASEGPALAIEQTRVVASPCPALGETLPQHKEPL